MKISVAEKHTVLHVCAKVFRTTHQQIFGEKKTVVLALKTLCFSKFPYSYNTFNLDKAYLEAASFKGSLAELYNSKNMLMIWGFKLLSYRFRQEI